MTEPRFHKGDRVELIETCSHYSLKIGDIGTIDEELNWSPRVIFDNGIRYAVNQTRLRELGIKFNPGDRVICSDSFPNSFPGVGIYRGKEIVHGDKFLNIKREDGETGGGHDGGWIVKEEEAKYLILAEDDDLERKPLPYGHSVTLTKEQMEPTKPTTAMEADMKREEDILAKVHRDYLSLYERRSKLYFDSFDPCITMRGDPYGVSIPDLLKDKQETLDKLFNLKKSKKMNTLRQNIRDRFFKKEETILADMVEAIEDKLEIVEELKDYLNKGLMKMNGLIEDLEEATENKDKKDIQMIKKTIIKDTKEFLDDKLMEQLLIIAEKIKEEEKE